MPKRILKNSILEKIPKREGATEKVTVDEGHNVIQHGILYKAGEQIEVTPQERKILADQGVLKGSKSVLKKILSDEDIEAAADAKAAESGLKIKERGKDKRR